MGHSWKSHASLLLTESLGSLIGVSWEIAFSERFMRVLMRLSLECHDVSWHFNFMRASWGPRKALMRGPIMRVLCESDESVMKVWWDLTGLSWGLLVRMYESHKNLTRVALSVSQEPHEYDSHGRPKIVRVLWEKTLLMRVCIKVSSSSSWKIILSFPKFDGTLVRV